MEILVALKMAVQNKIVLHASSSTGWKSPKFSKLNRKTLGSCSSHTGGLDVMDRVFLGTITI